MKGKKRRDWNLGVTETLSFNFCLTFYLHFPICKRQWWYVGCRLSGEAGRPWLHSSLQTRPTASVGGANCILWKVCDVLDQGGHLCCLNLPSKMQRISILPKVCPTSRKERLIKPWRHFKQTSRQITTLERKLFPWPYSLFDLFLSLRKDND